MCSMYFKLEFKNLNIIFLLNLLFIKTNFRIRVLIINANSRNLLIQFYLTIGTVVQRKTSVVFQQPDSIHTPKRHLVRYFS